MKKYRESQNFNSSKSFYEFIGVDDNDQFTKETGCNTMIKLSKSQISSKIKGELDLPIWEFNRRSRISNSKYFIKVLVNGSIVMETASYSLNYPNYNLNFKEKIQLNLFSFPESIDIQI